MVGACGLKKASPRGRPEKCLGLAEPAIQVGLSAMSWDMDAKPVVELCLRMLGCLGRIPW